MISTKITATYSFKKLANSIDEIFSEAEDSLGVVAEKVMKQKIDSGLKPPLKQITIKGRLEGTYWGGLRGAKYKTTSITPLKHTGALYKSLKFDKESKSINMLAYGKKHHDGFPNPKGKRVPPRPFMDLEKDNTFQTKGKAVALKSMGRKLKSAFSKKGM